MVEVGGLLFVVWIAQDALSGLPERMPELIPPAEGAVWGVIVAGSVLVFFAFIGFEDMVNVAEEVKDVRRTLPITIIITLGITTVLYMLVTVLVVYGTVNLALWRIKGRDPSPASAVIFPLWIPIVGFSANAIFIAFQASRWLAGS